ncbi:MAG TPA: sensor histidine kinase [Acidimicrobiales bacterium]|nr:sensor histidine kinase [Acidimicrobiales bacterium]
MGLSVLTATEQATKPFSHEALLYRNERQFLVGTLAFIREGLARDEPVLVVVSADKIAMLKERLGVQADRVQFADMAEVGANPARIIPVWRRFADKALAAGRAFRGIGEPIWADRPADELVECQRHERLINLAFADASNFRLLCPYDTSALGPDVLSEAFRSHTALVEDLQQRPSADCLDLRDIAAPFDAPLPEPIDVLAEEPVAASTLSTLRRVVARHARCLGLSEPRIDDLVVAVNEIASNTVRHGGGSGALRIWASDSTLICEVADRGHITDPLAGRVEPHEDHESGRGLWMATQLCDLIQVRSFATGSAVRLHMHCSCLH